MGFYLFSSLLISLTWLGLTRRYSIENFGLGLFLGFVLAFVAPQKTKIPAIHIPMMIVTLLLYIIKLYIEVFKSGILLTRRVFARETGLNTGIIAISTQDPSGSDWVAGLSAHAITATPGDMVVEFSEDEQIMYVHVLDMQASQGYLDPQQKARLSDLYTILGRAIPAKGKK